MVDCLSWECRRWQWRRQKVQGKASQLVKGGWCRTLLFIPLDKHISFVGRQATHLYTSTIQQAGAGPSSPGLLLAKQNDTISFSRERNLFLSFFLRLIVIFVLENVFFFLSVLPADNLSRSRLISFVWRSVSVCPHVKSCSSLLFFYFFLVWKKKTGFKFKLKVLLFDAVRCIRNLSKEEKKKKRVELLFLIALLSFKTNLVLSFDRQLKIYNNNNNWVVSVSVRRTSGTG